MPLEDMGLMDVIDELDKDAEALTNVPSNLTPQELKAIGERVGRVVRWLKEPV